jgi:hypothetical protein
VILSPPSARSREPNRCGDDSRAYRGPAACSEPGPPVPSLSQAQPALPVSSIVERSAVLSLPLVLSVALSLSKGSVEVKDQVEGSRDLVAGPRRRQSAAPSRLPCVGHDIDLEKKVASLQYRLRQDLGVAPHSTPQTDPIQGSRSPKRPLSGYLAPPACRASPKQYRTIPTSQASHRTLGLGPLQLKMHFLTPSRVCVQCAGNLG